MRYTYFLLSWFILSNLSAQRADNYKPDNQQVAFAETNLPIVFINTENQMIDRENRITAKMNIIYNGEGQTNHMDTLTHPNQKFDYRGEIGLKYRGNSSFTSSDKKPYAIQPYDAKGKKTKVSMLGMGKDNDWALLAPYSDKSMIRDMLAFVLAEPFFEYVPTGRYCEMIMDGTYYGVFILSERVRKGKYRIDLPDPGESGDELTGGYHLEIDRDDEPVYYSKHSPVSSDGSIIQGKKIAFQYKNMDKNEFSETQLNYIHGKIDEFENVLASSEYKNPKTGYRKYIDVTSFIDYMLSTEFCHNLDGYRLSTNIYKYRDSKDPKFKTSLWDLNLGFGNADYNEGWRNDTWAYNFNDVDPSDNQLVPFWWGRFLKDNSFKEEVKNRWKLYRESSYSDENIEHTIDSLTTHLNVKRAQTRNSEAWPRWGRYVWPNKFVANSYDEEIMYVKNWIKQRLIFMDKALLQQAPEEIKYTPLVITSGFNADIVAEGRPAIEHSSMALDDQGWVYYSPDVQEQGSLPINGLVNSVTGINYQLAAYNKKNAMVLKTVSTATLHFEGEQKAQALYLLTTSTNGTSTVKVMANYKDGTHSEPQSITIGEWYSDVATGKAVYGLDRVALADISGTSYRKDAVDGRYKFCMFEHRINTDKNKVIISVKIENMGNAFPCVFAVTKEEKNLGVNIENKEQNEMTIIVYPNPVANGEKLKIESSSIKIVQLISLQGTILAQKLITSKITEFPINGIAAGTYLLVAQGKNGKQTVKLIIE